MNANQEVSFTLSSRRIHDRKAAPSKDPVLSIPRIARLMALAIKFEGLVRDEAVQDFAELAQRGCVTRARMTQIMKLLDLAPDLQECILFSPPLPRLNERNLRGVLRSIDWKQQRRLFQQLTESNTEARNV